MNPTARLALVFLAAATAALAAAPPVDLPGWAAGLIAAAAAGFAGIGLLPPSWNLVGDGQRAVKKQKTGGKPPSSGVKRHHKLPLPPKPEPGPHSTSFIVARLAALVLALLVVAGVLTVAPAHAATTKLGAKIMPGATNSSLSYEMRAAARKAHAAAVGDYPTPAAAGWGNLGTDRAYHQLSCLDAVPGTSAGARGRDDVWPHCASFDSSRYAGASFAGLYTLWGNKRSSGANGGAGAGFGSLPLSSSYLHMSAATEAAGWIDSPNGINVFPTSGGDGFSFPGPWAQQDCQTHLGLADPWGGTFSYRIVATNWSTRASANSVRVVFLASQTGYTPSLEPFRSACVYAKSYTGSDYSMQNGGAYEYHGILNW